MLEAAWTACYCSSFNKDKQTQTHFLWLSRTPRVQLLTGFAGVFPVRLAMVSCESRQARLASCMHPARGIEEHKWTSRRGIGIWNSTVANPVSQLPAGLGKCRLGDSDRLYELCSPGPSCQTTRTLAAVLCWPHFVCFPTSSCLPNFLSHRYSTQKLTRTVRGFLWGYPKELALRLPSARALTGFSQCLWHLGWCLAGSEAIHRQTMHSC